MGLLNRIFGNARDREAGGGGPLSTHFHENEESEDDEDVPAGARNAPRRELVQVVLRDTMRRHGIPSDWVDVRMLSTINRHGQTGLHVCFVVKKAHERLLPHTLVVQDSFHAELIRFEPRAADWLLSVAWQFEGHTPEQARAAILPEAGRHPLGGAAVSAAAAGAATPAGALPPLEFPAVASTTPPATAAPSPAEVAASPAAALPDEDVQSDLQALFAIRDQALAAAAVRRAAGAEDGGEAEPRFAGNGFEPTRPGFDDSESPSGR